MSDTRPWKLARIEECWPTILDYQEEVNRHRDTWLEEKVHIKRTFESIYNDEIGLGMQLRWNLALEALYGKSVKEHIEDFDLPFEFYQLGTEVGPDGKSSERFKTKAESEERLEKLCAALNERFGASYKHELGQERMTLRYLCLKFIGARAPANFIEFVKTGVRPCESNGSLVQKCTFYPTGQSRGDMLSTLYTRLSGLHGGRPIQCIESSGATTGLRALACQLLEELPKKSGSPVFLVPCNRRVPPHNHRGIDFLVSVLLRYFQGEDLEAPIRNLRQHEIDDAIYRIRRYLTRRHVVIVFLGHSSISENYVRLREAIVDEPLLYLLSHLVHPVVDDYALTTHEYSFERNHLVVLSDGGMRALSPYCQEMLSLGPPALEDRIKVLEDRRAEDSINKLIVAAARRHGIHNVDLKEALVALIEVIWRVESADGNADQLTEFAVLIRGGIPGAVEHLTKKLKVGRTDALLILRFVALAQGGIRRSTLFRCMEAWANAIKDTKDVSEHLRYKIPTPAQFHERLAVLLKDFKPLLSEGNDEDQIELNPDAHPSEYASFLRFPPWSPESTFNVQDNRAEPALDLCFVELREAIMADVEDDVAWVPYLMHTIICAEALQQQTILLKSRSFDQISLRSLRRAFEALFNGFMSLRGVPKALPEEWPVLQEANPLPNDPLERFKFLYLIVLRRLVDGASLHRMSRQWAADPIKLDILLLAHRCFSPKSQPSLEFDSMPVWFPADHASEADWAMLFEHYIGASVSAYRAWSRPHWTNLQAGMEKLGNAGMQWPKALTRIRLDMTCIDMAATEGVAEIEIELENLGVDYRKIFEPGTLLFISGQTDYVPTWHEITKKVAEITARLISHPHRRSVPNLLVRLSDVNLRRPEKEPKVRLHMLLEALIVLHVAEELRIHSLTSDAPRKAPFPSVKGIRNLVVTELEILRWLHTPAPLSSDHHPARHSAIDAAERSLASELVAEVRASLDQYALSAHGYGPEIATVLVLESKFARILGDEPYKGLGGDKKSPAVVRHETALGFLREAERYMITFGTRPRLWLHFLDERCTSLRGLEINRRQQKYLAARILQVARLDLEQLKNMVAWTFDDNDRPQAYTELRQWWHERIKRHEKGIAEALPK